jgi:amino acid permease
MVILFILVLMTVLFIVILFFKSVFDINHNNIIELLGNDSTIRDLSWSKYNNTIISPTVNLIFLIFEYDGSLLLWDYFENF